jgi:pyruvate-formate lyase-activating enzyme
MDYYAIELLVGIAGIIVSLVSAAYWLGAKLARLEDRLDRLESDVKALKSDIRDGFNRLANAIANVGITIIEYLETRGIWARKMRITSKKR